MLAVLAALAGLGSSPDEAWLAQALERAAGETWDLLSARGSQVVVFRLRFGCGMFWCGVLLALLLTACPTSTLSWLVLTVHQLLSWRQCWQRWQAWATALMKRGWHRHWREQQVRRKAWGWFTASQAVVSNGFLLAVRQLLSWRQCWQHLLCWATALMRRGWLRHCREQQVRLGAWV
jgi:hypothetical protein